MLSKCTIVVSVHRNAVVPDGGGNVDTVIQIFILFALIELEFVRLDDGTHTEVSFLWTIFYYPTQSLHAYEHQLIGLSSHSSRSGLSRLIFVIV